MVQVIHSSCGLCVPQVDVRFGEWSAKDCEWLNEYQLLTAKPAVYLGEGEGEGMKNQSIKGSISRRPGLTAPSRPCAACAALCSRSRNP
jgi:hypothetical protein